MDNLAIVYDEIFLLHDADFQHPENSKRLISILDLLRSESFLEKIKIVQPEIASESDILRVHSQELFFFVRDYVLQGERFLDSGDTYITKHSWVVALYAAGTGIKAVDLAAAKKYKNLFCLVRPPGHHAGISVPMGFCLLNNIAVAAKYAQTKYGLKRIAIIDWDVHHGNGTQEIFYDTEKVYYISLHQYPFYPGTGSQDERGEGPGFDYTLNFPLPPRTDGKKYILIFKDYVVKVLEKYRPELILISAGFDAHIKDPLANMNLRSKDFAALTSILAEFADEHQIPIISFLEGGYNLKALAYSVYAHLKILTQ